MSGIFLSSEVQRILLLRIHIAVIFRFGKMVFAEIVHTRACACACVCACVYVRMCVCLFVMSVVSFVILHQVLKVNVYMFRLTRVHRMMPRKCII